MFWLGGRADLLMGEKVEVLHLLVVHVQQAVMLPLQIVILLEQMPGRVRDRAVASP